MTRNGDQMQEKLNESDFIFEGGSDDGEKCSAEASLMEEEKTSKNVDVPMSASKEQQMKVDYFSPRREDDGSESFNHQLREPQISTK